ncbi:DUF6115 domain-containing protein [Paenibacillus thermotolerans]|uniref:DUF6115 domain-containing protein n=1 Tax=Paenibacillus thermotolerans TaxID=3027807 RepID=UPI0023679FD0|nr:MULTISPECIES: hypothetical protein [unclassified Paenibacillus]
MDAWIIIVMLGVVILLYAFLLPKPAPRRTVDEEVLDTVEDTLATFVEELEQENKEFARMVGQLKREHEKQTSTLMNRIEFLERKTAMLTEQMPSVAKASALPVVDLIKSEPLEEPARGDAAAESAEQASVDLEAPAPESDKPATVKSRYKEVFDLYGQGKSIEFIAKKLGTNKGEIQLIIQLAKREEQADASK